MPIDYLDSLIVGQDRIKEELSILLREMVEGRNLNILLRAPSGYGKTYMAHVSCAYIDYITGEDNYYYYLCEDGMNLNLSRRIFILDETHLIKSPEFLYPLMDSGEYSFFICTNEFQDLKDPLQNRCFQLVFDSYTFAELKIIGRIVFLEKEINIDPGLLNLIIESVRDTPREVKLICEKCAFLFSQRGMPTSEEELNITLSKVFGIHEGGLNETDIKYLEFLRKQGSAGLKTISLVLKLPEKTVREDVEPFLMRRGMIKITGRGRTLC